MSESKFARKLRLMFGKVLITVFIGVSVAIPAISQANSSCEEEQRQAQAWIQWAVEQRAACVVNASSQETRLSCLQDVRRELSTLEQDHLRVYSSGIRTLHPNHPVVKNLVARLQDNVGAAETALSTDTEPEQIAALRNQVCLNRR